MNFDQILGWVKLKNGLMLMILELLWFLSAVSWKQIWWEWIQRIEKLFARKTTLKGRDNLIYLNDFWKSSTKYWLLLHDIFEYYKTYDFINVAVITHIKSAICMTCVLHLSCFSIYPFFQVLFSPSDWLFSQSHNDYPLFISTKNSIIFSFSIILTSLWSLCQRWH